MKLSISRQNVYLILLSVVLLIGVLLFSFLALIPKGQEYREQRLEVKKESIELSRYEDFHAQTLEALKELQSKNKNIIKAFDNTFNPERFTKQHIGYFQSLKLSKLTPTDNEDGFNVYEVNTTQKINSPKSFYDFLDALNKGDWIIGVNFPIHFKRDGEMIQSSFTMRVYANPKDTNTSELNSIK